MTRILMPVAAFAMLSFAAGPALAGTAFHQDGQAGEEAGDSSDTDPNVSAWYDNYYEGNFKEALAAAEKLSPDPENKVGRALAASMRAAALQGLGRKKEADRYFAEADRLAPDEPLLPKLKFAAAIYNNDMPLAADSLDRMISKFPDVVREIDFELLIYFLRQEPKGQETRNEDRRVAIARLGYGGDSPRGEFLAEDAVGILVKRNDLAGARELLAYIDEPERLENFLIQKKYAALWSEIEARGGPHLEKTRATMVRSAERAFSEAPDDAEALQELASAYRQAGRFSDASDLVSKLPSTGAAMAEAQETMGWAVNEVALAMAAAGRFADADRLFALLNDSPMKDGSWRVSMVINRLEVLVSSGQLDKAMSLMDVTSKTAEKDGSPFARQLVRRLKYCALSKLGRKDEATGLLPDLLGHRDDAPGPTVEGLLCAGEMEKAEEVALSALKNPEFEVGFLRSMQQRPLTSDDPSVWSSGWTQLRARPAIATEFDRLGRDLPEQYLPPALPVGYSAGKAASGSGG